MGKRGKPKGWRPLTAAEKTEIIARYEAGATIKGIAADYQRGTPAIRDVLVDAGLTIRNQMVSTPIELRIHDALKAAGIGFTTQALLVGRYLPDVLINQAPVVIEADGFHHCLPKMVARDEKRDAILTAAGYRIFRFTGSEINMDAVACVRKVIDACGLTADEPPVYDIRTTFAGESHPRWKGGKQEFTCCICETVFLAQPTHRRASEQYCSIQCVGLGKRGRNLTPEHRAAIGIGLTGNKRGPHTPEAKARIGAAVSASLKGKPKSPEHVAKVAAALKGRPVPAETRAKISETLKRRHASQIKIESGLTGDRESQAEMTWPLAAGEL